MRATLRQQTRTPPQVVNGLSAAEADLLSARLATLARALEPGLGRLNWSSRGIDDFVAKANAAVHDFQALVNQVRVWGVACLACGQVLSINAPAAWLRAAPAQLRVAWGAPAPQAGGARLNPMNGQAMTLFPSLCGHSHCPKVTKNAATLEKAVSAIAAAQLVADVPASGEPPELQEFYERMERARGVAVEAAVRKYRSLTPILCKARGGGPGLVRGSGLLCSGH